MKITKLFLAIALMLGSAMTAPAAIITSTGTKPAVGNGNSGSPYEIWTAEELRWFVNYENTRHWYPNDYAKLMADIDLSTICGPDKGSWIPLGVAEESGAVGVFYGDFNGNGHTVSGMYIDGKDTDDIGSRAGFFGLMTAGSVYNLTVEGDIINAYYPEYTGGMVAKIDTKSTVFSKDLYYTNCEARVNIWFEEKGGESRTLYLSGRYVGGFLGHSSKTDVGITVDHCVFSGDINFDNASAYSAVGAFVGSIGNNKPTNLQYCSAATSLKLPFIQYVGELHGNLNLNLTGCVNRGPMAYKLDRMEFNTYFRFTNCIYSDRLYDVPTDDDNGHIVDTDSYRCDDPEMFTNGFACYTVNAISGGNFFSQTIGSDKMPFPGSGHKTVYRVKEYTSCANDDFVYVYANQSTDITDKRQHTFIKSEPLCTVCHHAVNPDYGISKDEDGYYLAASANDIEWLWNLVNVTGITDAKIRLTADIDMADEAMEPLAQFSGIFDGQGHTLSGINISCTGIANVGLVGNLTGTIRNLTLAGNVAATYAKNLGAFAGYAGIGSSISNVRNDCTVKATGTMNGTMTMYIGGIAGYVDGSLAYAVNNGPIVDASVCTGSLTRYMGGVAGIVTITAPPCVANTAVVGALSSTSTFGTASAVVNMLTGAEYQQSYYVAGISNPGMQHFFSDSHNASDVAVSLVDVGSGRLAWLLAGKDYDADDSAAVFFGQTIGSDMVPYPYVSDEHQGVYNARHYYTCDSYSDYSNSATDEEPAAHTWNDSHYCSVCCVIDPAYMEQDALTKAYKVCTTDQYNTFAAAVNAACNAGKPMQYASASIQYDLDFTSANLPIISLLSGRIHGNGHKLTLGKASSMSNIATTITQDGAIEYLDVAFPSDNFYPMVYANHGRIVGCNVTRGIPSGNSAGLVIDCSGELPDSKNLFGRYTRCLIKTLTIEGWKEYRIYNSNAADNEVAAYTAVGLEKGESGELAYTLSHSSGNCGWGQDLGTDADPRIYYGQTPTSYTYVARLTSYSAGQPEGTTQYLNAGQSLEFAPGYFQVVSDPESWVSAPWANFIADHGDGVYTADEIKLAPAVAHHLPFEVETAAFSYSETFDEGDLVALMLPVDIPVSRINGKVYLFKGYNAADGVIEFVNSEDFPYIPANTPMLVIAAGGEIIGGSYSESYPLTVSAMTGVCASAWEEASHLAAYESIVVPESADDSTSAYYILRGAKAHTADEPQAALRREKSTTVATYEATAANAALSEAERTVSPLDAYFCIPVEAGNAPDKISVALIDEEPDAPTAIESICLDAAGCYPCDIWTAAGHLVMKNASQSHVRRLAPGIYIAVSGTTSRKLIIR